MAMVNGLAAMMASGVRCGLSVAEWDTPAVGLFSVMVEDGFPSCEEVGGEISEGGGRCLCREYRCHSPILQSVCRPVLGKHFYQGPQPQEEAWPHREVIDFLVILGVTQALTT